MKLWRCLDQLRRNQQQAAATGAASSSTSNELLVRVVRGGLLVHLWMLGGEEGALASYDHPQTNRRNNNHQPNRDETKPNQTKQVPFRESKITHLFMNHLSGAAVGRTVMLLNVNPCKVRPSAVFDSVFFGRAGWPTYTHTPCYVHMHAPLLTRTIPIIRDTIQ